MRQVILDSVCIQTGTGHIPARDHGVEGVVEIEFLTIGEGFVPKLRGLTRFDPIWFASLPDIAIMKAHAFQNRALPSDYIDLLYTLAKMKSLGQTFVRYRIKQDEIVAIQSAVG
jgi:hypothetical protein